MTFSMTYTPDAVTLVMRPDVAWALGSIWAFGLLALGLQLVEYKDALVATLRRWTQRGSAA